MASAASRGLWTVELRPYREVEADPPHLTTVLRHHLPPIPSHLLHDIHGHHGRDRHGRSLGAPPFEFSELIDAELTSRLLLKLDMHSGPGSVSLSIVHGASTSFSCLSSRRLRPSCTSPSCMAPSARSSGSSVRAFALVSPCSECTLTSPHLCLLLDP